MKLFKRLSLARRIGALLLAALLAFSWLPSSLAAEPLPDVLFTLQWGEEQAQAVEVNENGYDYCYWLFVPQGALINDARLSVSATYGQYSRFVLPTGQELGDGIQLSQLFWQEAGNLGGMWMDVYAYDGNGMQAASLRLYFSTAEVTPVTPPPVVMPAYVTIVCLDENWNEITRSTEEHQPGYSTAFASPISGYEIDYAYPTQNDIYEDASGASPSQVEFHYRRQINPVNVNIVCIDENWNTISSYSQTCSAGTTTISAQYMDGYDFDYNYPTSYDVTVTADGASMNEIQFHYVRRVNPVNVNIVCFDENWNTISSYSQTCGAGTTTIAAQPIGGYDLDYNYQTSYDITVTADGASMTEVQFHYIRQISPVNVNIVCLDENWNTISSYSQTCGAGTTTISAQPIGGYDLDYNYQTSYDIAVTADGASMNEVQFHYTRQINPVNVSIICLDENWNTISSYSQTCAAGTTTIAAQYMDGYDLDYNYPTSYDITVTADGASMNEVQFHYTRQISPVNVNIVCMDENWNTISSYSQTCAAGTTTISAQPIDGYDLDYNYQTSYDITVTADGASMNEVQFHYVRQINPVNVNITCMDENWNTISSYSQTCAAGTTIISAQPIDGYDINYNYPTQYDITVTADGASMTDIQFYYNRQINPVNVSVVCVDEIGNIIDSFAQTCAAGTTTIAAQPIDGYDLDYNYQTSYDITVTADGASMSEVQFHYVRQINPVNVSVFCVDENGNMVSSYSQACAAGTTTIAAQYLDGYDLDYNYPTSYDVTVTADGASMNEIQFHYVRQINPVNVGVICVDETGNIITSYEQACPAGTTAIAAQPIDGYDIDYNYQTSYDVTVTADGASVNEIRFYYVRQINPVTVSVVCLDENGNLIDSFGQTCGAGTTTIAAQPIDGYDIDYNYQTSYDVTVTADGASISEIQFHYTRQINPVDIAVVCVDEIGNIIASYSQTCGAGITTIAAQPIDGYDIDNNYQASYDVTVTADGASISEIQFHYTRQINPIDITVVCVDETGNTIVSYSQTCGAGTTTISALPVDGHDLDYNYPTSYDVTVTADGASMSEVQFHYIRQINAVDITVTCVDENSSLIDSFAQTCGAGTTTISALPIDGYDIDYNYQTVYDVTVTADGASVSEIQFHYTRQINAVNVNVTCVDEIGNIIDSYAQTCGAGTTAISAQIIDGYDIDYNYQTSYDITVTADGASLSEVQFYYIRQINPVTINITCIDENSNVFDSFTRTCGAGTTTIAAEPVAGYELDNNYQASYDVTVTADGASMTDIQFHYVRQINPVNVNIICLDENGNTIDSFAQTCGAGTTTIAAQPLDGYDIDSNYQTSFDVIVNADGASTNEIQFHYIRQINAVNISVICIDETGKQIDNYSQSCGAGINTIVAQTIDGYDLDSNYQTSYDVTVTADGASVTVIQFHYIRQINPVDVSITCIDEIGNVISSFTQTCGAGTTTISAKPIDNYSIDYNHQTSYDVTVTADGASVSSIQFYYVRRVNPVSVSVVCVDEKGNLVSSYSQTCGEGTTTISAQPVDGYDINYNYPTQYDITVTADGASMTSVQFYYVRQVNATFVTVSCVDDFGVTFNVFTGTCPPGGSYINAPTQDGYVLETASSVPVSVQVDADAHPSAITFNYMRAYNVPVYYRTYDGTDLLPPSYQVCFAGETTVTAPEISGYTVGSAAKSVFVDFNGPTPRQFDFIYTLIATEEPTATPTVPPTDAPTETPTVPPTEEPTATPTATPTPTPAPTSVIVETSVPVLYIDHMGTVVLETAAVVSTGENFVQYDNDLLPAAYTLYSENVIRVVVDEAGVCDPESVVFSVVAPMDIAVHYRNATGDAVASSETRRCVPGINPIQAAPQDLLPDYILDDESTKYVTIDENGADPAEIIFLYKQEVVTPQPPTPTPEPQPVLVPVVYMTTTSDVPFYTDNTVVCITGENTVTANAAYIPEGYTPAGPTSVTVTVDMDGNATPATVQFLYSVSNMTREATIYYRTEGGLDVASAQHIAVGVGEHTISAAPTDLAPGYRLTGAESATVFLNENGTLVPDSIVFLYELAPTERPTVAPVDYPIYDMDAWCWPKADNITLRTFPSSDSEQTIIRTVNQNELGHIEGYVVNSLNETWYIATFSEQTGYVRDTRVRLLTEEEVRMLFGYTESPDQTPTIIETPIPDGAYIDRWSQLNANSVNLRTGADKKSSSLGRFNKGTYAFILESQTVNNEKWYHVIINGKEGYMVASFLDMMTAEQSAAYQAGLTSPMPVRTPIPTEVPPSPTPSPTPAPTATPTATPTNSPAPYAGYALTTRSIDLRTGVTATDTTLRVLTANSLLYVHGQAFVGGVTWSSAEALGSGVSGYVPDEALRHISAEEAAPYLAALQPHTPTPTPTAQPEPYAGYAVTNGANVMIRNYADEKAEIAMVLGEGEVVWVMGQQYVDGSSYPWHIVQFSKVFGYVRGDQLRLMSADEQAEFIKNLRTPIPSPSATATAAPVTEESMSSYGYVTANNVRLRSGPGTQYTQIRMMGQYAFALVLGSETVNGQTWYHINQAGTEGYVMSNYFKVLTLGELSQFLTSDEYTQSATEGNSNSGAENSNGIISVEDFNSGVWKNPALTNVTYEPFSNIIATPTPNVELLPTTVPTTAPTATPTASPAPVSTTDFTNFTTPAPNAKSGGSSWLWIGLAAAAIAVGGGAYGYSIYRANQRRAAQRAAQRRQAQQQQQRVNYQQPTQQYPRQNTSVSQQTSVFTPPQPRSSAETPKQASSDSTTRHRRSDKHNNT